MKQVSQNLKQKCQYDKQVPIFKLNGCVITHHHHNISELINPPNLADNVKYIQIGLVTYLAPKILTDQYVSVLQYLIATFHKTKICFGVQLCVCASNQFRYSTAVSGKGVVVDREKG